MKIGLLGAARITPLAMVAPARVIPTAVLEGVAARDAARARAFARQHAIHRVFDDYESLVSSPDVAVVYNALPVNLHAAWSIAALRRGKHVICEKPLAMNADEVVAMQAAAADHGVRLFEAFHYRFHPAFDALLAWLCEGRIGRVVSIDAHFDAPIPDDGREIRHRPETGGGAMMDLGCYPLSWILEIAEDIPETVTASATLTASGVDESMHARLSFANGLEATLTTSMATDRAVSSALRVVGDRGMIEFDNPLAPHAGASLRLTDDRGTERAPINRISTYTHQLAAILDAVSQGSPVSMEGRTVLRQQRAIDAVYEAAGLARLRYRDDSA